VLSQSKLEETLRAMIGKTRAQAAAELKINLTSLYGRIRILKRLGVEIPKPLPKETLDIGRLNKIAVGKL